LLAEREVGAAYRADRALAVETVRTGRDMHRSGEPRLDALARKHEPVAEIERQIDGEWQVVDAEPVGGLASPALDDDVVAESGIRCGQIDNRAFVGAKLAGQRDPAVLGHGVAFAV